MFGIEVAIVVRIFQIHVAFNVHEVNDILDNMAINHVLEEIAVHANQNSVEKGIEEMDLLQAEVSFEKDQVRNLLGTHVHHDSVVFEVL